MNQITLKRAYINLAEAIRTWDGKSNRAITAALWAIPVEKDVTARIHENADYTRRLLDGDRKSLAQALNAALLGMEDYNSQRFLLHALAEQPSARRSFVNLAEAVRTINEPFGLRNMLRAIADLNLGEEARQTVLTTFLANTPHRWGFSEVHRHNLASSLARLLEGQAEFDVDRFIHHAASDSAVVTEDATEISGETAQL